MKCLNQIKKWKSDATDYVENIKEKDPAVKSALEVLLLYPSVHAIKWYRVSHYLYKKERYFFARMFSQWARWTTGIEIHPGATIGKCLFIDHGMGVVIGETAEIGDYVTLHQGVTLGGTGKETGKRHPTIGDRSVIGANANVLGPIVLAAGTKVGAGSVLLKDTALDSTAVGIPAKVIKKETTKVIPIVKRSDNQKMYNEMSI